MWTRQVKILKFTDKNFKKQNDSLIINRQKTLKINDKTVNLEYTPTHEKEMILGRLSTEGYTIDNDHIKIHDTEIITTPTTEASPFKVTDKLSLNEKISGYDIYQVTAQFQENALLFKDTAISESAAICEGHDIIHFAEDLHRLNAIDKAIGLALKEKTRLSDSYLLTSGKIDDTVVQKAYRMQLPMVVSRTAPTSTAVDLAESCGIVLIGFARGKKCSIYTYPERITKPS